MKKLILMTFFILSAGLIFAQSTKGKEFWFGYISNLVSVAPDIYISAEQDVNGTIGIPGLGWNQNFNVNAGTTQSFTLPIGVVPAYNEGLHNLAVHVTSCDSITVYAVNPGSASSDATVVYPQTSLGIDYSVLNMTGNPGDWGDAAIIVATEDNTDIEITPSVNTDGGQPAGVPFTITLDQGELYQLTHNSGASDLTGTKVVGVNNNDCLPFAVFSGSQCINIGGCTACDHLYEQLLPDANLGMTYAAIPHAQKNLTHYRVLATQNNTDVFVDGVQVANLNAGQFYQFSNNTFSLITASQPVSAMQYAQGVSCGGPGDPFEVLLYPVEQSLENITFNALQTPLVNDYWVNILVETANVANVTLDGANISGNFTPFPSNAAYSYARINIGAGDHTLTSPGGALANVYGWGNAESFGYCAGASLKNLTNDFDIDESPTCINDPIDFSAVPDPLTAGFEWDFGDGSAVVSGQNATHGYNQPGTYDVTLTKIINNGCNVNIVKPVDIVSPPIAIDQNDTSVCAGTSLDLKVPVNEPFDVERYNDCGDTVVQTININYDTLYWSTGESGDSIQITPMNDTVVYVYGENSNSTCMAVDSVVIDVIDVAPDFSVNDVCLADSFCVVNQTVTNGPVQSSDYYLDNTLLYDDTLDFCHKENTAGVYDLKFVVVTDIGCTDSITKQVEVFAEPDADFTFVNACDEDSVSFTSTSQGNGGTISNYYWDIDNDTVSDLSGSSNNYEFPSQGTYDIIHFIETASGCRDTVSNEVTVHALPNVDFTFENECLDTLITFEDASAITPVTDDQINQLEWRLGDGTTANGSPVTHQYSSENSYDVELIVTTNKGCKDTLSQEVTPYPLPDADFSFDDVCLGETVNFVDESTVSSNYTTNNIANWNWDFDDGNTSTNQNPNHDFGSHGTFTVDLNVITNNGCEDEMNQDVTIFPLPDVSFTGENLKGCAPLCPTLTSTSSVENPFTIANYEWTLSDGTTYTGSSFQDCYQNNSGSTDYYGVTLTVETAGGCIDDSTANNYIEVNHNPIASFNFSPEKPDVIDNTVAFINTSLYADTYDWTIDGLGSYTSINPEVTFPAEPESYEVQLVASTADNCVDTARSVVVIQDRIVFYVPNTFTPDQDDFNEIFQPVFTSGFDPYDFKLLIFNRWGEVIFESNNAEIGWDGTYGNASQKIVPDGTYIWKIEFKETMSDERHTHSGHVNVLK